MTLPPPDRVFLGSQMWLDNSPTVLSPTALWLFPSPPPARCLQEQQDKLQAERAELTSWASRLAALSGEFDCARREVRAARDDMQAQQAALAMREAQLQVRGG